MVHSVHWYYRTCNVHTGIILRYKYERYESYTVVRHQCIIYDTHIQHAVIKLARNMKLRSNMTEFINLMLQVYLLCK